MKVTPPTSECTGGGVNGGANGIGWFTYSNPTTSAFHIRFLIKIQPGYVTYAQGDGTKFFLQDSAARTGIMQLRCDTYGSKYCAFGVWGAGNVNYYNEGSGNTTWWENAPFKVTAASRSGEWIAVEYYIDKSGETDVTGVYLWTQDGAYSGKMIDDVPALVNDYQQTGGYFSYYNGYGTADADNYVLIDNIVISDAYIGPPAGFVGGEDSTAPSTTITTANTTVKTDALTVTGTATDGVGVSGCKFRIGSAPDADNGTACTGTTSWSCPTSGYSEGANTLYVGCYDAAGNYGSDSITVTLDTTAPVVSAFTVPETSATRLVISSTFTCTGSPTGYTMNESAEAPLASADGWTASAPTSYTFSSDGAKTLYGWCKDAAGNVSTSVSDTVTVTTSGVTYKAPFIIQ